MHYRLYNSAIAFPGSVPRSWFESEDEMYTYFFIFYITGAELINSHSHFILHFKPEEHLLIRRLIREPWFRVMVETGAWKLSIWDRCRDVKDQLDIYKEYCRKQELPTYFFADEETYKEFLNIFEDTTIYKRDVSKQSYYAIENFKKQIIQVTGNIDLAEKIEEEIRFEVGDVVVYSIERVYTDNFKRAFNIEDRYYKEVVYLAKNSYKNVSRVGNPEFYYPDNLLELLLEKKDPCKVTKVARKVINSFPYLKQVYTSIKRGKIPSMRELDELRNIMLNYLLSSRVNLYIDYLRT